MSESTTETLNTAQTNKVMNIALWAAQGLLAVMFGMAGFMKVSMPIADVIANTPALEGMSEMLIRFIGASELAGAIGLLVPAITRIQPTLTAYAGIGLALIMVLAAIVHAMRGEFPFIGVNILLGGLALFVAWGRLKKAPILPKS